VRVDLFDYELPARLIAQEPHPRGTSRLLVLDRASGSVAHRSFSEFREPQAIWSAHKPGGAPLAQTRKNGSSRFFLKPIDGDPGAGRAREAEPASEERRSGLPR
jgi:hypothetical protein